MKKEATTKNPMRHIKEQVLQELYESKDLWFAPTREELVEAKRLYTEAIKAVRTDSYRLLEKRAK